MSIGRKIMAGFALIVAAIVIKRYMKKREEEEKRIRETDGQT
jgi:ABC-type proline/glycine betaine transport system permease subunit